MSSAGRAKRDFHLGRRHQRGINVAEDRNFGGVEGKRLEIGSQTVLRGLHQRAMERSADRQHDGALGAALLGEFGGALDGGLTARNYGLVG